MTAADGLTGRERIVQQSFLLFLAQGYDATTMSQIVAASGMSKGAVYHHFASKEELFHAAIDRYFVDLARSGASSEEVPLGFGEAVRRAASAMTDGFAHVASLGADLTAYYRFIFHAIDKRRSEVAAVLAERLALLTAAAERDGAARDTAGTSATAPAPNDLARMAMATIEGAALLAAVEDPERVREAVDEAVDRFVALVGGDRPNTM
ncbi:helix-turn-helix domain-containing protein [Microbacterium sp.]|uniref:TetR/AcrR family transcriptional regulator n=1 Tax=Microbacterium sp. TaxID=51671 RepID=UPI0028112C75|nr:helix-turn-helix domain-containing protein [Microbacterium sp.]